MNQEMREKSKFAAICGALGMVPQGWVSLFGHYGSQSFYAANLGAKVFSFTVGLVTAPLTEFVTAKALGYTNTEAAIIAGASLVGTAIGILTGNPILGTVLSFGLARVAEAAILHVNY
jgi:hypothetical protein